VYIIGQDAVLIVVSWSMWQGQRFQKPLLESLSIDESYI